MSESQGDPGPDWDLDWDDVVDVICVGTGAGVRAYRKVCAAADLDVLAVSASAGFDPDTAAYIAAMTEGLVEFGAGDHPAGYSPAVTRAGAAALRRDARGRPDVLEPFVGQRLRDFSARCLASPSGVLFTAIPKVFTRMRTDSGEIITAALIDEGAPLTGAEEAFAGLVFGDGRPVGAVVDGPSGRRRVRADAHLAFALGNASPAPAGEFNAVVSRPAARFATLGNLDITDDADG